MVVPYATQQPDSAPGFKYAWLPRLGGLFETAVAQFSIRRRHRMIFAFYLGAGLAFSLLFLDAPWTSPAPPPAAKGISRPSRCSLRRL